MHFFEDQNIFFLKKMNFYGIKLISTTDHGICHDKRKNQPKYICWGCHDKQNGSFIYLDLDYDITLEGFQQLTVENVIFTFMNVNEFKSVREHH